jgi:uncharacterized protein (TIGR03435 family)
MIRFCLPLLFVSGCLAQTFEAASVKVSGAPAGARPITTIKGGPGTADPGQITWSNLPMRAILLRAYGIRNYQLVAPKWVDTEQYNITAKIPAGATAEQFRAMLRSLLAERFKLAAREETREGPAYAMLAGKNGTKLHESKQTAVPETPAPAEESGRRIHLENGFPTLPPGPGMKSLMLNGSVRMTAQAQDMAHLAETLSVQLDRDVEDLTGLKGLYDFHLSYTPESVLANLPAGPDGSRPDTLGTDVFTSLGDQLGLKLESRKGPVKMVYVNGMEKVPSEN